MQRTAPKQFVFMTAIMDDIGNSSTDPWTSMPALLTSTSIGSEMALKQELTDSSESTSKGKTLIHNFSFAAVSSSCGARSGWRIVASTWCPPRASSSAVAKPIPELQPVTRTVDIPPRVTNSEDQAPHPRRFKRACLTRRPHPCKLTRRRNRRVSGSPTACSEQGSTWGAKVSSSATQSAHKVA